MHRKEDFIGIEELQIFTLMPIALIATVAVFWIGKGTTSIIALYCAVFLLGIGVASAYALTINTFRFGSFGGLGVIAVVPFYLMPNILMLNFTLYAVMFNDITEGLKGKLKMWTVVTLTSFSIYLYMLNIESKIVNWMRYYFASESAVTIVLWIPSVLWILSSLFTHWAMFIRALKLTQEQRAKKTWAIIAFFLPIAGSALYLIVHFAKVLNTIPCKQVN
ncbi:MAG: hypothetical protein FWC32_14310 [Firmicutes bacterium]|nr:hypothetical protein [Bacillota bacterium]